jgi:hypothetical protein
MKTAVFWNITQCSPLKVNRRFVGTCRLQLCLQPSFTLAFFSVYSSTLKMEAKFSSEMFVDFQRTERLYIPEDSSLDINIHHECY